VAAHGAFSALRIPPVSRASLVAFWVPTNSHTDHKASTDQQNELQQKAIVLGPWIGITQGGYPQRRRPPPSMVSGRRRSFVATSELVPAEQRGRSGSPLEVRAGNDSELNDAALGDSRTVLESRKDGLWQQCAVSSSSTIKSLALTDKCG
jgi:hypothetical protein